jgi:CRISPR-associated protein Csb3
MATARIPVDLFNPGQVFACLGFMEAAESLVGDAEGGFDWRDEADVRFVLRVPGNIDPIAYVLAFLAEAKLSRCAPADYRDPPPKKKSQGRGDEGDTDQDDEDDPPTMNEGIPLVTVENFPGPTGDRMTLPIRLHLNTGLRVDIGHWADESSRDNFKLYAGNRSADGIAKVMLSGQADKQGRCLKKGIAQLWANSRVDLVARPFHVTTPMGGRFNFDPRGAWTSIDAGYSPDTQGHAVAASPVVEFLAAWGMENARPQEYATRKVRYAVWGVELPLVLARAALVAAIPSIPSKSFHLDLALSGKNKVVTFATLEKEL